MTSIVEEMINTDTVETGVITFHPDMPPTTAVTLAPVDEVGRPWQLVLFVPGSAAPQGSKNHVGNGVMVESSKKVKPWRHTIAYHVSRVWRGAPLDGPVSIELEFVMPRPKATPKRRTPPAIRRPDIDKLQRAVLDSLTRIVWRDDSVITRVVATKRIAELDEQPGCLIRVGELNA